MSGAGTAARPAREVCAQLLAEMMLADERLVCLDSDTGQFARTDFGAAADRYVNLGIAEQNLLGTAAGLARAGRIPVVHTMATFAATRALEAVKIDVAFGNLAVHIVATHGGLSAGSLGPTHHALEDVAVLRTLPNLRVVVPADADDAAGLLRQCLGGPGPSYLRLGREGTPPLPPRPSPVRLGRAQVLRPIGGDVTIVGCGPRPVRIALHAADVLAASGVAATVLDMHTVKPLDVATLTAAAGNDTVLTVEDHWAAGGLGSAVAECLAERGARVRRIGAPDRFFPYADDHEDLLGRAGVTAGQVVATAHAMLAETPRRR
ncbi:transketolase C-terminal domain-containing protein [Micromonospora sp. WMMD1076]|uniref:transketolase family protein n=1 Tax=Micromonospora sp. WMMD1076 TaxID=3016103 RepID=UPI00249C3589|nr:transketolase C-terminal domain-containing protein [Micromonospora sp. WMMD1076]WFF05894.1 transketolase C-terminal domain-containing protein [Micromonospora sp. WMMD1076]